MLENLSKILVVDNEQRELNTISRAFHELNIPVYTLLYSHANPPEEPYSGIRLVFFDIKLQDGNHVDIQTITSFENALRNCIDVDNGPFVLIFWSTHIDSINSIKDHIKERIREKIPTPILVDCIDKTLSGSAAELKEEIKRIISNDFIEILFDYDKKISKAAGKTLNTIFNVVSNGNDSWGENKNFEENFDLVFSNIAYESRGFNNAKKNPLLAIRDGLNPILINELNSILLSDKWIGKLNCLCNTNNKHEFRKIDSHHICQLNTIFHINFDSTVSKIDRGAVVEFNPDDQIMMSYFGLKIKQICHTFLPFIKEAIKEEVKRIKDGSRFIMLEISAACDFAQNNHRNHTYILGILIPVFDFKILYRKSDAIIISPCFIYEDKEYIMFFNSRYTFNCPYDGTNILGNTLFQLKNDLLNKIITQYSFYISRLGLIQF